MALYVGIDVSKDKFDACGIGEGGKRFSPYLVSAQKGI
jgi:transposase